VLARIINQYRGEGDTRMYRGEEEEEGSSSHPKDF